MVKSKTCKIRCIFRILFIVLLWHRQRSATTLSSSSSDTISRHVWTHPRKASHRCQEAMIEASISLYMRSLVHRSSPPFFAPCSVAVLHFTNVVFRQSFLLQPMMQLDSMLDIVSAVVKAVCKYGATECSYPQSFGTRVRHRDAFSSVGLKSAVG